MGIRGLEGWLGDQDLVIKFALTKGPGLTPNTQMVI